MSRFVNAVDKTPGHGPAGDCWIWRGDLKGCYGTIFIGGRNRLVHRYAYAVAKGSIPRGLEVDHTCGVTICVNPDHLEAVTHAENMRRQRPKDRRWGRRRWTDTHCSYGHELTPENVYVSPKGKRACRKCNLASQRAWQARWRDRGGPA